MKTIDKFGGDTNHFRLIFLILPLLFLFSCSIKNKKESFVYSSKKLPIYIYADSNYHEYGHHFSLANADSVRVHCAGEIVQGSPLKPWDLDHIELFFDMQNQKARAFGDVDDVRYTITRFENKLLVNSKIENSIIKYKFSKKGIDKIYEVYIPWKSLKFKPTFNKVVGFDCSANDNDSGMGDRTVDWHSPDTDAFLNTSLYGNLKLQKFIAASTKDTIQCTFTTTFPKIDGEIDDLWKGIPIIHANSWVFGKNSGTANLSMHFRTCWNWTGLYFLFEIKDDVDVFDGNESQMRDYGWIEDQSGDVVWEFSNISRHNGGAEKNKVADNVIFLRKGEYLVRYSTDESHSPQSWDAAKPSSPFYGISLERIHKK